MPWISRLSTSLSTPREATQRAEHGRQLVEIPARLDPRMRLGHPFAAQEAGHSPVPASDVRVHCRPPGTNHKIGGRRVKGRARGSTRRPAQAPSSTSRTLRARESRVKGFRKKAAPGVIPVSSGGPPSG